MVNAATVTCGLSNSRNENVVRTNPTASAGGPATESASGSARVTTLEFFQHHSAKSGHGDGLLMTRQLISTFRQPPLHYLTRSVRRTSGFVLVGNPEVVGSPRSRDSLKPLLIYVRSPLKLVKFVHPG